MADRKFCRMDDTDLVQQQRDSLWFDGHAGLYTVADALSFMREVGVALRYGAAANLPIASVYRATQRRGPIYALRRGAREPTLLDAARQAFDFIIANENATGGDIRRLVRSEGQKRPDSADLALAELQRELLDDRRPSGGPT
jgi:hypothetical protein